MIILPYNKSRISMKPFITFLQKQKLADNVDIFEKNVRNLFPLQYIKLQTAEKMYKTNFVPSNNNLDKNCFSTFVLNKETEEPVEVIVKVNALTQDFEEYYIYDKTGTKILGKRYFMISKKDNILTTGYMETFAKNLLGIGTRLQQIGNERRHMLDKDNVEIVAIPQSYIFHMKSGFEPLHKIETLNIDYYEQILNRFSDNFCIDKNEIEKMMIAHRANGDSDKIELEKYVSYENILKYLYAQLDKSKLQACHLSLRMKLSDGAKEEWDKLIEISPIFIGKNFPKGRI